MSLNVDTNWWKDLFDEIYLQTDARSIGDEELTRREVDFLEQQLLDDKSAPILDLCGGQGRHSLELSRREYQNVTVLDFSLYLLELGKNIAHAEHLSTTFIQGDARYTGFHSQSFRFILIMASSFGYFPHENENQKILHEGYRLLMPNGTLLLDLPDREYVIQNFKSHSQHRVNEDIIVKREREIGNDIINSREIVISDKKGLIRDRTYCTRLYSPDKISGLMRTAGFSSVTCQKDFMSRAEADYGVMNNRMIVIAKRN
jgi:D-alanine-D-alanine ligase